MRQSLNAAKYLSQIDTSGIFSGKFNIIERVVDDLSIAAVIVCIFRSSYQFNDLKRMNSLVDRWVRI